MAARSTLYWSASTEGFFDARIHGEDQLPADAVRITPARHAELMAAQARGAAIERSPGGVPVIRPVRARTLDDRREAAIAAIKGEARRRIEAGVPLWRQINDMLALSSVADPDHEAALSRRAWVDRVRAASNGLERLVEAIGAADLAVFDPALDSHWPA